MEATREANTLYYIPGSPPARALMLACRMLDLQVTFREMDFINKENWSDWFLKINPRHCVPTLVYEGEVFWESRATMKYLVDKYAQDDTLYPKDRKRRYLVDRKLDYDLGHVFKAVGEFAVPQVFMLKEKNAQSEKALRVVLKDLDEIPELVAGHYMCGEQMTLADVSLLCSLTFLQCVHYDIGEFAHLAAWMQRVKDQIDCYSEVDQYWQKWVQHTTTEPWKELMRARMRDMAQQ